MQQLQTGNELEEEQLLNFVVNKLKNELQLNLDEKVKITPDKIYETLVSACTNNTSINHIYKTTENSPHANTVRGHLKDQFDLETLETIVNSLLQHDTLKTLPDRPTKLIIDLHLRPFYGNENKIKGL